MAPFVPNGVYKIRNVEFNDQVAELANGNPMGQILGASDSDSIDELWLIENVGVGGNQIIIESIAAPRSFANARQIPGTRLVGSRDRTVWTVMKVDRGYYLQSPNANLVWLLPEADAPILLVPHTGKDNTKWEFNRIDE